MTNRLLGTVAAIALIAGIGGASAQSDMNRASEPHGKATQSQVDRAPTARPDARMNSDRAAPPAEKSAQSGPSVRDDQRDRAQRDRVSDDRPGNTARQRDDSRDKRNANTGQASSSEPKQGAETDRTNDRQRTGARDRDSDRAQSGRDAERSQRGEASDMRRKRDSDRLGRDTARSRDDTGRSGETDRTRTGESASSREGRTTRDTTRPDGGGRDRSQSASVSIDNQQRTRVRETIMRERPNRVSNVNFSISVGTRIPDRVRLAPLPASIVSIVPQYRGYEYVVVRDEIIIVEPRTKKIVTVISSGGGNVGARSSEARFSFNDKQRKVIREHARQRVERPNFELRVGATVPESVTMYSFPDVVYEEVPTLREYRYVVVEDDIVLVDPREHRIVEIID
jgi:hypothetical protein